MALALRLETKTLSSIFSQIKRRFMVVYSAAFLFLIGNVTFIAIKRTHSITMINPQGRTELNYIFIYIYIHFSRNG